MKPISATVAMVFNAIVAVGMAVDPGLVQAILASKTGVWCVAAYASFNTFLHAVTGPGPVVKP